MNALGGEPTDDLVHVAQAAKALDASRRTIDRMMEAGQLERVRGADGRTYVTKRSLVEAQEERSSRRRGVTSEEIAQLLASLAQLIETMRLDRLQLTEASREREDARVAVARLEGQLEAERARRRELEAQLNVLPWRRLVTAIRLKRPTRQ